MTKAGTAHFTVDGDFITDTARRFWNEEDEPEKAMNLLRNIYKDGKPISDALCLEILGGKKKLTGDSSSGIKLEDDTAPGRSLTNVLGKLKAERDEARDERADLAQLVVGDTVMTPSPTGARDVPRRKAKWGAFSDKAGTLRDGYEFDDVLADPEARERSIAHAKKKGLKPPKPQRIYRQKKDDYVRTGASVVARIIETGTLPETDEEREARYALEDAKARENAKRYLHPADKITGDTGWLSPEGIFYPCDYAQHALIAYALDLAEHPQAHSVEPQGWIRLGENDGRQYFFDDEIHTPMTPQQESRVRAWCAESGAELPYELRKGKDE